MSMGLKIAWTAIRMGARATAWRSTPTTKILASLTKKVASSKNTTTLRHGRRIKGRAGLQPSCRTLLLLLAIGCNLYQKKKSAFGKNKYIIPQEGLPCMYVQSHRIEVTAREIETAQICWEQRTRWLYFDEVVGNHRSYLGVSHTRSTVSNCVYSSPSSPTLYCHFEKVCTCQQQPWCVLCQCHLLPL